MLTVLVTSDLTSSDRRIDPSWSIEELKAKLEPITGIPPEYQSLLLYSTGQQSAEQLTSLTHVNSNSRIHVLDTRPAELIPNFQDESEVDKYEMPKSEYEERSNTVLAWKKANKLGRFDPNATSAEEQAAQESAKAAALISVGDRCEVSDRRGCVRYVGPVPEIKNAPGAHWIGIEFDEPTGKNDGSIGGKRYFNARENHGSFVKPALVKVGDFPEKSLFDSDEEEL